MSNLSVQITECPYCKGYPTLEECERHKPEECTCSGKGCGVGGCPRAEYLRNIPSDSCEDSYPFVCDICPECGNCKDSGECYCEEESTEVDYFGDA